ncbi:TT1751-like protein [Trametes punicea]|nr:TT1751-like protein [Trametes punicea]
MSKTAVEYTAKRITYRTPLSFSEIAARLERELNKPAGGPALFRLLGTAKSKEEIEHGITTLTEGRDFIYFAELVHHRWLSTYTGSSSTPRTVIYTFGNPIIAQTLLRRDLAAGLHVPLKLMLLEDADGNGTRVIYDDPASVVPIPSAPGQSVDDELKKAAEGLSAKVEMLVKTILAEKPM